MEKLDIEELGILVDALEAWVHRDLAPSMLGDLLSVVVARNFEEAKAEMEKNRAEGAARTVLRKEQAILIQAKLIRMKDKLLAESLDPGRRVEGGG